MKTQKASLPYVNNGIGILLTVAINLAAVFLFFWPGGVRFFGVLLDSCICVAITTVIDLVIVYGSLKKMRVAGAIPRQVPVSKLIQRLPKNPVALGAVFFVVFGVLTVGVNALVLWFFGMQNMAFVPWMAYKLVYSAVLSAKIIEYAIFRYVQPDWAGTAGGGTALENGEPADPVKNPLPKISVFKEMYGSVTMNIAMNIIIGTALGGVVIDAASDVVIYPTTIEGIPITGLVFGLIVGILVTNGVLNGVKAGILAAPQTGGPLPPPDKRFTWMPKRKLPLTCLVCVCMMAFSSVALWAAMKVFGLSIMNFYQFTIFITIYATLVSKPLSGVLVRRCMQPDYILYVLEKQTAKKTG